MVRITSFHTHLASMLMTKTYLAMIVVPLFETRPSAARSEDTKSSTLKLKEKLTPS